MGVEIQLNSLKGTRRGNKKRSKVKTVFYIIISLVIIVNAAGLYVGNMFYTKVCKPETSKAASTTFSSGSLFSNSKYSNLQMESASVASKFDYRLYGTFIKNPKPTKNTIIIVHGINGNRLTALRYADIYLDKGFNVLVYDSRDHGASGGTDVTYGYYERYDLDKWVTWVQSRYKGGIIGIHGESMGAATALMYSQLDQEGKKRIKFYVVDCPYSDLDQLFTLKLKQDYKINIPILSKIILFYSNKVTSMRSGFKFNQVSPINSIKNVTAPIMFIHGDIDTFVPTQMSKDMYNIKKGPKALYIAPGASHAQSYQVDKDDYRDKVINFIDSVNAK